MIVKIRDDGEGYVNGVNYFLGDSSPKRVLHHTTHGMAVISACQNGVPINKRKDEFTDEELSLYEENLSKYNDLKSWVRNHGYGYIECIGGYPENYGTPDEIDVDEFSLIIPYMPEKESAESFVKFAIDTGRRYQQNSVLIAGIPEVAEGQARYLNSNGTELDWFNPKNTNIMSEEERKEKEIKYYTQAKKGKFNLVFDSESRANLSHIVGVRHIFGLAGFIESKNTGSIIIKDSEV